MDCRVSRAIGIAAAAVAVVSLAPVQAAGQTKPSARTATAVTKTWTPPRTVDGQPDLQGVWDYRTLTPLERPTELEGKQVFSDEEAATFEKQTAERRNQDRRDGAGTDADVGRAYNDFWWDFGKKITTNRTSLIVDPPDGRIPERLPAAQKRAAALAEARRHPAAGPEDRNLWERCITRNLPRLPGAYNNNFQIFQSRDYVVILQEMIHEARVVPLDGRPHGTIRQWLGDSRGRWEGNTLVVDTVNFTDKTSFNGSGQNLHLVERFTRVDPETINYDVTIEDPTAFTKSWTVEVPMNKSQEKIYEYACHEGNYGIVGILEGARANENTVEKAGQRESE